MQKLYLPHHSPADWDFESDQWAFDYDRYRSPPSSLRLFPVGAYLNVVCKKDGATSVPYGRLTVWCYHRYHLWCIMTFRNQCAIGTANRFNCYRIYTAGDDYPVLQRCVDNVCTTLYTFEGVVHGAFDGYRITFIPWLDDQCNPVLKIALEDWRAWGWEPVGFYLDPEDTWKDSDLNRLGYYASSQTIYYDDITIEAPE